MDVINIIINEIIDLIWISRSQCIWKGLISTMIEMFLAGADKRDLVKMIDKKVVKRQEAILNVVETGDDCEDVVEYLENIAKASKK